MFRHVAPVFAFFVGTGALCGQTSAVSFSKDIQPIFEASCWKCHGAAIQLSKLDLRSRELVAIAALAASGKAGPQLRTHVESAASVGISKAEVTEILMQVSLYAGFPASLNALADCHDLLTEEDILPRTCSL